MDNFTTTAAPRYAHYVLHSLDAGRTFAWPYSAHRRFALLQSNTISRVVSAVESGDKFVRRSLCMYFVVMPTAHNLSGPSTLAHSNDFSNLFPQAVTFLLSLHVVPICPVGITVFVFAANTFHLFHDSSTEDETVDLFVVSQTFVFHHLPIDKTDNEYIFLTEDLANRLESRDQMTRARNRYLLNPFYAAAMVKDVACEYFGFVSSHGGASDTIAVA